MQNCIWACPRYLGSNAILHFVKKRFDIQKLWLLFFGSECYIFTRLATKVEEHVTNSVKASTCSGFECKASAVEEVHLESDCRLSSLISDLYRCTETSNLEIIV